MCYKQKYFVLAITSNLLKPAYRKLSSYISLFSKRLRHEIQNILVTTVLFDLFEFYKIKRPQFSWQCSAVVQWYNGKEVEGISRSKCKNTSHSAYVATETELVVAKIDGLLPPNFL